jgi:hypothetical protein
MPNTPQMNSQVTHEKTNPATHAARCGEPPPESNQPHEFFVCIICWLKYTEPSRENLNWEPAHQMQAVMEKSLEGRVEDLILDALTPSDSEHPFEEVVEAARSTGADDSTIKAAIWRLRSRGELEVTPQLELRAANRSVQDRIAS